MHDIGSGICITRRASVAVFETETVTKKTTSRSLASGTDKQVVIGCDTCNRKSKTRRLCLRNALLIATAATTGLPQASKAAETLPSTLRGYTKLAPLGPANAGAQFKSAGLSPDDMARRLANDLIRGANGNGGYFISGDISQDLFRDDCVFEDPTNRVNSLSQYQKALTLLFDPERSTVELLGNGLTVERDGENNGLTTITGRLRSRGYLKVAPWKPYVKAYETTIVYTLDPDTGLVARQDQQWSKDATEALKETFTPSWNGEAPKSTRTQAPDEPAIVTALFGQLNGRRPNEYSAQERMEIDEKINAIVNSQTFVQDPQTTNVPGLAGKWVLVYLQPGPEGAGIDRRLPFFPDLDFNDSFQVFSSSTLAEINNNDANRVTNIGQVLGSLAEVRVSGSLREVPSSAQVSSPSSSTTTSTTKRRFEATIEGGKICLGASCPIDLPMIQGKGVFDSLYLGDRLRIGQNINGGGARVVQVRL